MKKNNYFLLLLIAIILSVNVQARKILVGDKPAFQTAFNGGQDKDTIVAKPGVYNFGTALRFPPTGLIVVKSAKKDSMAIMQMEIQIGDTVPDGKYPKRTSIIFENMHLQGRYGNMTTASAYIISLNNKYMSFDTLAFRNCEISNASRCLIRSGQDKGWQSGEIEWLEMSNCLVHDMNSRGNVWPVLYVGHIPMFVNIKNNTFYDMPWTKSIFALRSMPVLTGRNVQFNFENNTVAITYAHNQGAINTGKYFGEEATFNIKNNMFITPNWSDDKNLTKDSIAYYRPAIIRCVGGIIKASNNVVDSMQPWLGGQMLDIDGQGGFLVIDTLKTYKMKDLNVSWNDFADPKGSDFSYLSTNLLATAGVDGGPIGDPRWVKKFTNPRILTASANLAAAVVTPTKAFYENGTSVTLKGTVVDGYTFKGWKNVSDGSLISTENPYTFTITSNMDILADYQQLQPRTVSVTISGSKSASYTITPAKSIYYVGDVITVKLNSHSINNFVKWNDGNTDLTRTFTIADNLALIAEFTEHPYYLAWDFDQLTANNQTFRNLAANHASNTANPGVMNYVMTDTVRTISTRNNKFTGTTAGLIQKNCLARRTIAANFGNPDYVYIKFSTKGLTNLKVKCDYGTDNSLFPKQKMQYAVNKGTYSDFAIDNVTGDINMVWRHFEGVLPVAAENQDSVSVRWIPDTSTERLYIPGLDGTTSTIEYAYITNIIVIDNTFSATKDMLFNQKFNIYSAADKLYISAKLDARADVYSIMGQKIKDVMLNTGMNEISGLKSGLYVVKIENVVQKVLIK